MWLDNIIDNAINDYVSKKLDQHHNATSDELSIYLEEYELLFKEHILHEQNCSKLYIIGNESTGALPYLYPFMIEFSIVIASVWYMIWSNIGTFHWSDLF